MDQFIEFVANHPLLFAAFGGVIVALIANELHGNFAGPKRLPPSEAVRFINDEDPIILDVRNPSDFKKGHLLNAVNIPSNRIGDRAGELGKTKDRPVLTYCAMGSVASSATEQLKKAGYANAVALKGGLNNWQQAGLPVTRGG